MSGKPNQSIGLFSPAQLREMRKTLEGLEREIAQDEESLAGKKANRDRLKVIVENAESFVAESSRYLPPSGVVVIDPAGIAKVEEELLRAPAPSPTSKASSANTVSGLIERYRGDPRSPYHSLRYKSREHYDVLIKRIADDCGHMPLEDMNINSIELLHLGWKGRGASAASAYVGMLRTLIGFGSAVLEEEDCHRVLGIMSRMRFEPPKQRAVELTAEFVNRIRAKAHVLAYPSIALAQALQFEGKLRQKDVIGEWVPLNEGNEDSDIQYRAQKWLYGLRWRNIEGGFLRHKSSFDGSAIELDLSRCPMISEEIERKGIGAPNEPMIAYEAMGIPYHAHNFRRVWRIVANAADVPRVVKNMDSRPRRPTHKAKHPGDSTPTFAEDVTDLMEDSASTARH